MAVAAFTTCNRPGCPTLVKGSKYCPRHAEQAKRREYDERNSDEVRKLYHTKRWEKFTWYMIVRNPQCQRLVDGKQCEQSSKICHHIVSPRVALHLMFDAENILCVCVAHHPPTQGEPDVTRYVKTIT
jgi:hypothetical protein